MSNIDRSIELEAEVDETEHEMLSPEELAELEADTEELMDAVAEDFAQLKAGIIDDEDY